MKARIFFLLLFWSLASQAADSQEKSDLEKIKGTWKLAEAEPPKGVPQLKGVEFIKFGDKEIALDGTDTDSVFRVLGTFELDSAKKPKELDITFNRLKGQGLSAIYMLEGDRLKICWQRIKGDKTPAPRPKEFKGGEMQQVLIFQRLTP